MSDRKAYVFLVPGTWETKDSPNPLPPTGMTKLVADRIPAEIDGIGVECLSVPYTSGYGDRASYLNSVNNGKRNLTAMMKATPDNSIRFVVGYSQGGTIGGDVVRDWGVTANTPYLVPGEIHSYYGIADPRRNRADWTLGADPGGCGITGERGQWGDAQRIVHQFARAGDIICTADPNTDFFMEASKFTNKFWVGDPITWLGFTLATIQSPDFQRSLKEKYSGLMGFLSFNRKLRRTIELGIPYLQSGIHGCYGGWAPEGSGVDTCTNWIAADIVKKIEKEAAK